MNITINNIKALTHNAFQDLIYDKTDTLVLLKNFFEKEKNPLGNMIYEEFNYYWNDLFSKQILEHSFVLSLPDFVKPSVSVWLLNWKEYIEEKYNSQYFSDKFTVREMKVQEFQDEINKVKTFFTYSKVNISQAFFESLESGLNFVIPHYYNPKHYDKTDKNPFSQSFVIAVFLMAKMTYSKEKSAREEDLTKFFKCYYSSFYNDKESGRNQIFNTSCYNNTDHVKMMKDKVAFLQPKSLDEEFLLYHLNVSNSTFANALNPVLGLTEYSEKTKENYAISQLQSFFSGIKVSVLDDKLKLTNNLKTKKLKI